MLLRCVSLCGVLVGAFWLAGCSAHSPDSLVRAVRPEELNAQEWVALSQPGAEHKELERFVGEWRVRTSLRGDPNQAPIVSEGVSTISWVLDKRFVEENFSGSIAGQPYQGRGFFGYERATRRYVSVWFESIATGVTLAYGSYGPEEGNFRFEGSLYDPLLGRVKKVKTQIKFSSRNEFAISILDQTPTGEEFPAFEFAYHRKE